MTTSTISKASKAAAGTGPDKRLAVLANVGPILSAYRTAATKATKAEADAKGKQEALTAAIMAKGEAQLARADAALALFTAVNTEAKAAGRRAIGAKALGGIVNGTFRDDSTFGADVTVGTRRAAGIGGNYETVRNLSDATVKAMLTAAKGAKAEALAVTETKAATVRSTAGTKAAAILAKADPTSPDDVAKATKRAEEIRTEAETKAAALEAEAATKAEAEAAKAAASVRHEALTAERTADRLAKIAASEAPLAIGHWSVAMVGLSDVAARTKANGVKAADAAAILATITEAAAILTAVKAEATKAAKAEAARVKAEAKAKATKAPRVVAAVKATEAKAEATEAATA